MNTLLQLQAATLAARERTGDQTIGTQTEKGRVQVVRVTFAADGAATVIPLTRWVTPTQAFKFLNEGL